MEAHRNELAGLELLRACGIGGCDRRAGHPGPHGPLESVDVHECGQLRLGAAGDQLEVLPLEDGRVPVSEGPRLASPALEESWRPDTAELERHSQWEVDR